MLLRVFLGVAFCACSIGGGAIPRPQLGPPEPPTFRQLCTLAARLVRVPKGVDAERLLYALGGVESSFGSDLGPRYAPSYGPGGRYHDPALSAMHGDAAASSLGPWQLQFANAAALRPGVTPADLDIPRLVTALSAEHLQLRVLDRGASTVAEIADAWNSGSYRDSHVPTAYIARVQAIYDSYTPATSRLKSPLSP